MKAEGKLLYKSVSFCPACGVRHEAAYVERDGKVWFGIDCPAKTGETVVSSDAALFSRFREKHRGFPRWVAESKARYAFYLLEVTDRCNLKCPVCFAGSSTDGSVFITVEEVARRAAMIRENGGSWVTITGGEAAVHPQILDIVRAVKTAGLRPILATNGVRIAEEKSFALDLKKAGLLKAQLQFDTFDPVVSLRLRGEDLVSKKITAADHIIRAGIRLGLVMTACADNVAETRPVLKFAATLAPVLNSVMISAFLPTGRFPAGLQTVTREDILHSLIGGDAELRLSEEDFFPMFQYRPWGIGVHPDCSVHTMLMTGGGTVESIARRVHVDGFYSDLSRHATASPGLVNSSILPLARLFANTTRGNFMPVLKALRGFVSGRKGPGMFALSVGTFMKPDTRDEERLERCSSCMVSGSGFESPCLLSCTTGITPLAMGGK